MTQDPFALPAFILAIISLVVAVIGALTGIVALAWQIVTRTRGAHRIKVRAVPDMMLVSPGSPAVGPYIQVEIINRGASAVQVQNWSILLPNGNALMIAVPAPFPPSPPLPHLLQPGTSVSFYSLASDLEEEIKEAHRRGARAAARLATGELVRGKKGELGRRNSAQA